MKLTCAVGIPWLENCGLYGSSVTVTEVTCTLNVPGGVFGVAAGVPLQPNAIAPPITNTGMIEDSDFIALTMVAESTKTQTLTLPLTCRSTTFDNRRRAGAPGSSL